MLLWMRRYGWVIFALPLAVFWVDDFLTNWHHRGTDSYRHIFWENMFEDAGVYAFYFAYRHVRERYLSRQANPLHCVCHSCNFEWVMRVGGRQPFCPRCGAPEPL